MFPLLLRFTVKTPVFELYENENVCFILKYDVDVNGISTLVITGNKFLYKVSDCATDIVFSTDPLVELKINVALFDSTEILPISKLPNFFLTASAPVM